MAPAQTRTVYLRKGMKFNALLPKVGKKGKFRRKRFVGPCAVEMTEAQIVAFKDLLQTQPQTLATEPAPEVEEKDDGDGEPGPGPETETEDPEELERHSPDE